MPVSPMHFARPGMTAWGHARTDRLPHSARRDYVVRTRPSGAGTPGDALARPSRGVSPHHHTHQQLQTMHRLLLVGVLAFLFAPANAEAQETLTAFRGATILPISGPPIPDGVLVVADGRIAAVGPAAATPIPAGATVVDVTGRVMMPGLVDTHSHIGGGDGGDRTSSVHPAVRIFDSLNARDRGIRKAQSGGITTVNVMPGSGLLLSGQTLYLKLRNDPRTVYDLLVCEDYRTDICGGIKMANGTNPIGTGSSPGTRARSASLVREKFIAAQEYRDRVQAANGDASGLPPRDLEMEALVEVLDGRRMVHHHTHRHDDILTAIRLAEEFGYRMVLQHVSEAWRVADEIAASGYPSSIIILDSPGGKLESLEFSNANGMALERAGALVGFHTDDGITDSRFFLRSAGMGVRDGMSREAALEAMTIAGARMLDMEERVGTLEVGKDADFIILTGDPLSVYTHVEQTWVEGVKVFDRADPEDLPYATGGPDVYRGMHLHMHHSQEGHE